MTGPAFKADRDELSKAAKRAGRALSKVGSAYDCLLLEVTGDDLAVMGVSREMAIRCEITVEAGAVGWVVVPPRLFADAVASLRPGPVEITTEDDALHLEQADTGSASAFTLRTMPPDTRMPWGTDEQAAPTEAGVVQPAALVAALERVGVAVSDDRDRPILGGVAFSALTDAQVELAATDSYRMAVARVPITMGVPGGPPLLVPQRALAELTAVAGAETPIAVRLGSSLVQFDVGRVTIRASLISGDYPKYAHMFPATLPPNVLEVDRQATLALVKRLRVMSKDGAGAPLRLSLGGDTLFQVIEAELGEAEESLPPEASTYSGDHLNVAFNVQYLAEGLEAAGTEKVRIHLADDRKPALLVPVDGDPTFRYLLMPVTVGSTEAT